MKKLILLRHAKSSWDDPALSDHDRTLNARGKAAAPVIAAWLAAQGHLPDTVLCSSAVRTRETFRRMAKKVPALPEPVIEPSLYHASPGILLDRARLLPEDCESAMIIGHQPGLGAMARRLSSGAVPPGCAQAFEHFPTAAAAVFEIAISGWKDLAFNSAEFVAFAKPRELMGK